MNKSWVEKYPTYNVSFKKISVNRSWKKIIFDQNDRKKIEKNLSSILKKTNGKIKIYPLPDLIFNAFNYTLFNSINVVIVGQDPYFNYETIDGNDVPQAMGLSFSVQKEIKIPSSLKYIYKNLKKYQHHIFDVEI